MAVAKREDQARGSNNLITFYRNKKLETTNTNKTDVQTFAVDVFIFYVETAKHEQ